MNWASIKNFSGFLEYGFYAHSAISFCLASRTTSLAHSTKTLSQTSYFFIQFRNISTVAISTIFCIIVVSSPNLVYSAESPTSLTTLLDFELVMMSVVPYSYFKRFVDKVKPDSEETPQYMYPVFLKLYTKIELLLEKKH